MTSLQFTLTLPAPHFSSVCTTNRSLEYTSNQSSRSWIFISLPMRREGTVRAATGT